MLTAKGVLNKSLVGNRANSHSHNHSHSHSYGLPWSKVDRSCSPLLEELSGVKAELSAVTNELSGVKAENVFLREDVERLEAALTKSRELYIGLLGRRTHGRSWCHMVSQRWGDCSSNYHAYEGSVVRGIDEQTTKTTYACACNAVQPFHG